MCYKQKCKVVSLNLAHPVVTTCLQCLQQEALTADTGVERVVTKQQ